MRSRKKFGKVFFFVFIFRFYFGKTGLLPCIFQVRVILAWGGVELRRARGHELRVCVM